MHPTDRSERVRLLQLLVAERYAHLSEELEDLQTKIGIIKSSLQVGQQRTEESDLSLASAVAILEDHCPTSGGV